MMTLQRQTPPAGGAHQIFPARMIGNENSSRREHCPLVCAAWDSCPWKCPIPVRDAVAAVDVDLLAAIV